MNTTDFFKKVLPESGFKVLAELVEIPGRETPGWKYHKYESHEVAAAAALRMDASGRVIYHACNAYGDWYMDEVKQKKRLRTQQNVVACRALYDDVDVGKVGCYETRKEAGVALKDFLSKSGMPKPMVVFSGGGLHLYWPLTADVDRATWDRLAGKKRLITKHFGLKVDAAVDVDSARVLRPVGSTWRKHGEAREVELKVDAPATDVAELEALMDAIIEREDLSKFELTPPSFLAGIDNSDLGVSKEFPESYAEIVASHCSQVRQVRDTGGESEPIWRAAIGVLVHCKDGFEKAHEWSAKYPTYDQQETQTKLDNWATGPTTCELFRSLNSDGCMGCAHKCKSPIQLGMNEAPPPVPKEPEIVEAPAPKPIVEAKVDVWKTCWPDNFGYDEATETIWTKGKDEDGVVVRVPVANPLFYPLHHLMAEDGTVCFQMRVHVRDGVTREFELPLKYLQDGKALSMQLAQRQIHTFNPKMVQSYMSEYMMKLRKQQEERLTYRQFGWDKDYRGFLIGSTLITGNGLVGVTPSESIPDELRNAYATKGSIEEWSQAVNKLYNVKNGEPYQFVIAAMFGAILNPLLDFSEWKGIPLAVTSDESGYGKTTISMIALNMYGPSERTKVADTTPKAIPARCSSINNLPYLLDEMTKSLADPIALSDVLYTLSNGKPRVGLTSGGTERKALPSWSCTPIITGNRNILSALTGSGLNPEATQLRCFEVDINSYPRLEAMNDEHPDHAEHRALAQHVITNCYGTVGTEWIKFVINNKDEIQQRLRKVSMALPLLVKGDSTKERFYMHLLTCTLVGAFFARRLGFISFNMTNLRDWAVAHLQNLRIVSRELNATASDHLAAILSDLSGRILVTQAFDSLDTRRGKIETPINPVRGSSIDGRMVLGGVDGERPKLYITARAFAKWCDDNKVNAAKLKRDMLEEGIIKRVGGTRTVQGTESARVSIGRGIHGLVLGNPWCMEIDFKAAKGASSYKTLVEQRDEAVAA